MNLLKIALAGSLAMMLSSICLADELIDGKKLFEANCAKCHGADGTGSDYGKTLEPYPARNLRAATPYVPRDELRRVITHGLHNSAMTAKKYEFDPIEIEALVDHVKTFTYTPNADNGQQRFKAVCAQCHGEDGRAKTGVGAKNLVYSKLELAEMVHTIRYGRPGTLMTAKRHQLSNVDIADIANYAYSLRRLGNAEAGMKIYQRNCQSCHASPSAITLTGHAARPHIAISDLDDHLLDLRIRHGRHARRAGERVTKLHDDQIQDVISYLRAETE